MTECLNSPGQKQDATVHVDKVAEGVDVGAGHAAPSTVVQSDASGQRQRHQQIRHSQVYSVNHRGGGLGGGPAEHTESQTVEDHTDHQHHTVTHLQHGEMECSEYKRGFHTVRLATVAIL